LDRWEKFISDDDKKDVLEKFKLGSNTTIRMDNVTNLAFLNTSKIINSNHRIKEKEIIATIMKGNSSALLPLFGGGNSDLIYLDGSHYYEEVKLDVQNSKRLVKQSFGIICGDELEKMPNPALMASARSHKKRDFVDGYHPGVLLAAGEEFESVNMEDGFWWVYSVNGKFKTKF
jgi:hypothetical protein